MDLVPATWRPKLTGLQKGEKAVSKKLYLETGSGISGDMFVAAMLDLGADQKALEAALASLPVKGFKTEISRVQKSGIDCCDFNTKYSSG